MDTVTKSGNHVHTMLHVVKPEEVVGEILALHAGTPTLCVAVDLDALKMSATAASQWVMTFNEVFASLAPTEKYAGIAPPVVTFGAKFTRSDKVRLEEMGAVVIDRSLPANANCQTSEALLNRIDTLLAGRPIQSYGQSSSVPSTQKQMSPADLKAANSYPVGTTHQDLVELFRILNQQPPQTGR